MGATYETKWIYCPICSNKNKERYRIKKFSAVLPEMQTGNID